MIVAVLGASGKTGRYVAARLARDGHRVVAVGRSAERLARIAAPVEARLADLENPSSVRAALADADIVVSLAHEDLRKPYWRHCPRLAGGSC